MEAKVHYIRLSKSDIHFNDAVLYVTEPTMEEVGYWSVDMARVDNVLRQPLFQKESIPIFMRTDEGNFKGNVKFESADIEPAANYTLVGVGALEKVE